jgi:tRNA-splicing ligase RtcB
MTGSSLIDSGGGVPIRAWIRGVPVEEAALAQLRNVARLPFIHCWVAAMPDVHLGIGATVGSVIPTVGAIVPAAVGVDIGCGMAARRTSLKASDLPDDVRPLRLAIEAAVPHGRTDHGGRNDRGAWKEIPAPVQAAWEGLQPRYERIVARHARAAHDRGPAQLGTLGTGNHFIELCLDTEGCVWVLLHSGSRGPGNRIGTWFIELARLELGRRAGELPDRDLSWLAEDTDTFRDYWEAVAWAQDYARRNRELMLGAVFAAMERTGRLPPFRADLEAVDCHHNYVARETHFGRDCYVTRKGAVRAGRGELGIIPGSMGARSYIVRGLGNPLSFESCSHGAGRALSRGAARRRFTAEDHARATAGIECRKDQGVIDETPMAYKDIDAVMAAQADLVEVVTALRQILVVKG